MWKIVKKETFGFNSEQRDILTNLTTAEANRFMTMFEELSSLRDEIASLRGECNTVEYILVKEYKISMSDGESTNV